VPLARIQSDILRLLAAHRDPESYVAGAAPLNVDSARYSDDIDVSTTARNGWRARRPLTAQRCMARATM
jgi:hypothetical protein